MKKTSYKIPFDSKNEMLTYTVYSESIQIPKGMAYPPTWKDNYEWNDVLIQSYKLEKLAHNETIGLLNWRR